QLGLTDPVCGMLMGETAEEVARDFGITRQEQDEYALQSHRRAAEAQQRGILAEEITPVPAEIAGKDVNEDVGLRKAQTLEALGNERAFASAEFARKHLGRDSALGELPRERMNVNGGAIALGHPVGASGTRLVLTLLKELRRRDLRRGLATLCVGGGQGAALLLETEPLAA